MPLQISLVCSFGMSTSIIEEAVRQTAQQQGMDVEIRSIGTGDAKEYLENTDVFLLGPQVRYAQAQIRELGKPVDIINFLAYATADGNQVLAQALSLAEAAERK